LLKFKIDYLKLFYILTVFLSFFFGYNKLSEEITNSRVIKSKLSILENGSSENINSWTFDFKNGKHESDNIYLNLYGLPLIKNISITLSSEKDNCSFTYKSTDGWTSGYFDPTLYLNNAPDVKDAGVNPWKHFLEYGWEEKRNFKLIIALITGN